MRLNKALFRLLRAARTTLLALFLVASLTLNVASIAFDSVATLMSAAYSAVTGAKAVTTRLKDQISAKNTKLAKLDAEIRTKNPTYTLTLSFA